MPLHVDSMTTEVQLEPEPAQRTEDQAHQREQLAHHLEVLRHAEHLRLRATSLTEGSRRAGP